MTVSHWKRPAKHADRLECDAVVVGAGICGVSAALHLERRGLRVDIVERHTLASGASSRNAGFLMRGAADNYVVARRDWGPDLARRVWRMTEENLEGLRSLGIDTIPSYRAIPSALLALEPIEEAELVQSVGLLRADGFDAEWVARGDARWADAVSRTALASGALINPADGSCNPWDLLRFLASRLKSPLRENQEVYSIEAEAQRVVVRTTSLDIVAPRVLVCTNAYAPLLFPALAPIVTPRRGQMLALRAPDLVLQHSYYANRGFEYFRQAHDGAIVVGGCRRAHADDEIGYADTTTQPVQRDLEAFASRILGIPRAAFEVVARWSGVMGFTRDALPVVTPLAGEWPQECVWFVGGCTGHGMSLFHRVAALAVAAAIEGVETGFSLARETLRQTPGQAVHNSNTPRDSS